MPEFLSTEILIAAAESSSKDSHDHGAAHSVDSHAEYAVAKGVDDHAHDSHGEGYGHDKHDYARPVSHPPELPHFIQILFEVERQQAKKEGRDPYGDPESPEGINLIQGLHVGYMGKPAPFVNYGPWENNVFAAIAALGLIVVALIASSPFRSRSKEQLLRKPTRLQTAVESIVEVFDDFIKGVLGPENGRRYLPFIGAMFFTVLAFNLMGIIPLMKAPSSSLLITLSLAICTFLTYQWAAWTRLGPKMYILHLAGYPKNPVQWLLAPLMIVLEGISDFVAKPLSLALRLFGNVLGKDILLGVMMLLGLLITQNTIPAVGQYLGFPLTFPFYFLALLLSAIQALVFSLLSAIYILLVLPHDHDHEDHHHEGDHQHGHDAQHAH
jgi:F-type H+-transporting ATPase subunit a